MKKRAKKAKHPHLVMLGSFLLFFVLMVVISGGLETGLGYTPRPWPLGWALFVSGTTAAVLTVDRWAKALPGIFGVATLNSIIILADGHALNQPSVPVPRWTGALLTAIAAGASAATAKFVDRDLENIDPASFSASLSCFVAMYVCIMAPVERWEIPVATGLIGCIAVLWARSFRSVRDVCGYDICGHSNGHRFRHMSSKSMCVMNIAPVLNAVMKADMRLQICKRAVSGKARLTGVMACGLRRALRSKRTLCLSLRPRFRSRTNMIPAAEHC
jgi:hypothetical protein